MDYKAVIFDLDGTLLNTLADLGNAVNHVLIKHSFPPHELEAYRFFVGDGARMLVSRALPSPMRDEKTIDTCLGEFLEHYERNSDLETDLYPGVPEMLDKLTDLGIRLAVLSNKPHALTLQSVDRYFSRWEFEAIFGQREGIPQKPDPAGALMIADKTGIPASSFLYVGDSGTDMKTAVSAGMFPAGALWGFRTAAELKANGARILLNHPLDVFKIMD